MNDLRLIQVESLPRDAEVMEVVDAPARGHEGPSAAARLHALLRGRYHWAVMLALTGIAGGICAGYFLPPVRYRSTGLIRIKPSVKRILFPSEQNAVMPMFDSFMESQVALINSARVLDYAMQNPDWQGLGRGLSPKIVTEFRDSVEVEHPRNSEVIIISLSDRDPDAAGIGVKAVIEAYQKLYGETDADNQARTLQILEDRRTALANELKSLNERVLGIANEFGTDSLGPIYDFKLQQLNHIEVELQQAKLLLASVEGRSNIAAAPTPPLTAEVIAPFDPELRLMLQSRREQQMTLTKLASRYGQGFPQVVETRDALEQLNRQIAQRVEQFSNSADANPSQAKVSDGVSGPATIGTVRLRRANLEVLWNKSHDELLDLGRKNLKIQELRQEAEAVKGRLDATAKRIEELNVEASAAGRFDVFSSGDRPLEPYKDKRIAIAAAGGAGGGALGVAVIALLGLINRRFRSVADTKLVGPSVRLLGVLPALPSRLDDPEQSATAAHCLHQIRAALQIHRDSPDERVFAITSPSPGAGKTSLSLALGVSFAAAKCKTLLIDCDIVGGGLTARVKKIVRRRIGQIFVREGLLTAHQVEQAVRGARKYGRRVGEVLVKLGWLTQADIDHAITVQNQTQVGLLDVLAGERLGDCVTGAGIPGLFVLTLGTANAAHVGRLSPQAIRRIIDAAKAEYDVVLIDTGPLLGSIEATMAIAEADKVVLVLARGEPQDAARQAISHLQSAGAKLAGVVFNRATPDDIELSGYSSVQSARSAPARPAVGVRMLPVDSTLHVGPIGSAVASSTAADH